MLKSFSFSEGAQWRGFESFVLSNVNLHRALASGDAVDFGRIYNGPTYAQEYGKRLTKAGW